MLPQYLQAVRRRTAGAPPWALGTAFVAAVLLFVLLLGQQVAYTADGGSSSAGGGGGERRLTSGTRWAAALGWGGSSGGYDRDGSPEAQYKRIIARLERLTSALATRGGGGGHAGDAAALLTQHQQARVRAADASGASDLAEAQLAAAQQGAAASLLDGLPPGLLPFEPRPMGRRWFITYGDARFNRSRARIAGEAARFGVFDVIRPWGPEDLDVDFVTRNYAILSQPRGGGYWLWKPYVVWETLRAMDDGDVLFYADAGCTFLSDPTPYLELAARYGMVAFRVPHPQFQYTKGLLFAELGLDMETWGPELQIIAGILVLQKRPFVTFLVSEWLRLAQDERFVTDADTSETVPNHMGFVDHRHDQSIWSLLVHKYGAQLVLNQRHFPPDTARIIAATRRQG